MMSWKPIASVKTIKNMDFLSFLPWILLLRATIHLIRSLVAGNKNLPPGPLPLPIVGNLFQLGSRPHNSLAELAKHHGPIMCLQLGSIRTIVISSASVAKQALHTNDAAVCNRTTPDSFTALQHNEFSFVYMPVAARWKSFRKICNSHVFSTSRLDASRLLRRKKLEDLVAHVKLRSKAGEAVEIGQVAFNTALNLLSNTFFSVDLGDPNSSISREFKEVFWQVMLEGARPNFADYFPVLKWIDPQRSRRRMGVHFNKLLDLFGSVISRRMAKKDGCLDGNDALAALLNICHENNKKLELTHIPHLLMELFITGTDTTSNIIEWAMAELLGNPDKMNKARQELERVVGKGIPIKEEDIPKLPYLAAVIKETLRKDGPPLITRRADSDIELCGFKVPKNSQILVNLWAIGRDPSLWSDPGSFEPERFVGAEIDVIKGRDFKLIPFGAGRRICPGLPLAMRMIPLMLGSLINCFEWKLEDGVEPETMDMDAKFGLTLQKAQPLRAIPIAIM